MTDQRGRVYCVEDREGEYRFVAADENTAQNWIGNYREDNPEDTTDLHVYLEELDLEDVEEVEGYDELTERYMFCIDCNEPIDKDHDDYEWCDEGVQCQGCHESDVEHSSTLIRFAHGDREVYRILDHKVVDAEYWEEVDIREWVGTRGYVHTDGWRGYYITPIGPDMAALTEGWATGRYSDVPWKHSFNDLCDWMEKNGEDYPPPGHGLFFLLEPTSNLFAMGITVFCHNDDTEAMNAYLKENGFDIAVIDSALS